MLENVPDISTVVPSIVDMFLNEFALTVETKEYCNMLLQGLMICMWYDCTATLQALENSGKTEWIFQEIFKQVSELSEDFEVKRFMLGLSSILIPAEMPTTIQNNYATIMKVLVFLSEKSI